MAARENQGLHIALILFVMITVLLAVVCYFTWSSSSENADKLATAEDTLKKEQALREAYQIKASILEMYIGLGTMTPEEAEGQIARLQRIASDVHAEVTAVQTQYDEDMRLFDVSYTGLRNYRELPGQLEKTLTKKNIQIGTNNDTENRLIAERDSGIAAAQEAQEEAETKYQAEVNDKNQLTAAFRTETENIKESQLQGQQDLNTARQAEQTARDEARDSIALLNVEIENKDETIAKQRDLLAEYEAEEFDVADGRITDISPRSGVVWLNVGFADNLPRNATFSVYPQDSTLFTAEGVKGMIEVKRILGAHVAEARVTMQTAQDPILPGDAINTTTWSPGRKQTFGIAGFIDIDNDGLSDSVRLRNIITRNGGEVVAYIDENGDIQGSIDAKTRYLVTGDDFRSGSVDDATLSKMIKSTTDLNNTAREEGVEKKYFHEMLEEMGYRGEASTQGVGSSGAEGFVPRRPPSRGAGGGAY